jgi:hypothetical protein
MREIKLKQKLEDFTIDKISLLNLGDNAKGTRPSALSKKIHRRNWASTELNISGGRTNEQEGRGGEVYGIYM